LARNFLFLFCSFVLSNLRIFLDFALLDLKIYFPFVFFSSVTSTASCSWRPFHSSESPAFSGRAVVELLQRPRIMEKRSGSVQVVAELAREFGFIDPDPAPREQSTSPLLSSSPSSSSSVTSAVAADGSSKTYRSTYNNPPSSIRSLKFLLPNFVFPQIEAQVRAARKRSSTHGASGGNEDQGEVIPAWIKENVPDILLPWSVFSGNPPPPPLDD
jgi:dehydrogenase/reductase SDR family protein 1